MNAHVPEVAAPAEIRVRDKKTCIAIKGATGEDVIGEIVFNPDDTNAYKRFLSLAQELCGGAKKLDSINVDTSTLDKRLESAKDMESAMETFKAIGSALSVTDEVWEKVCAGLDELFGAGVTQIFTQGQADPELLEPLFDAVTPYYNRSRSGKSNKYRVEK